MCEKNFGKTKITNRQKVEEPIFNDKQLVTNRQKVKREKVTNRKEILEKEK